MRSGPTGSGTTTTNRPDYKYDPPDDYDFTDAFDARAESDDVKTSSYRAKDITGLIKNFLLSKWNEFLKLFQSGRESIENKLQDSQSSIVLTNVKQNPVPPHENKNYKSVDNLKNSNEIAKASLQDYGIERDNVGEIVSENILSNNKYKEEFDTFRKVYEKYKNGQLTSIDNFKTQNAKLYAIELIKKYEENIKNDSNYFFKNIADYKDVVVASAVLDKENKFALKVPEKDEEKNFRLWIISKDPVAFAKLRISEPSQSVDFQKAKAYSDWVVFQNLIGELPENVDRSIIPLAMELRNMMESAKAENSIDSLNYEVDKITGDLMAFFEESTSDKVTPLSPSANDQRPATSVKSASVPELTAKSLVSSDPPPPPPPRRLKATSDAGTTNAGVLTDIAQSTPPLAPPPRVRKSSEEIQQKPKDAVVTLRPVAEPDVERNNLSLSQCVDVFKNLSRSDQTDLGKLLAPDMALSDFRSLVNQSSLFFTDTVNVRPIDKDRQADVYKLSGLWDSAKKNPLASNGLSQLRFFRELDYLMNLFKRPN
jgi:hypothetical protein